LKATTHRPNPTGARPSDRRLALPSCRRSANAIGILLLALGLAAPAIALAATTREPQLMLSWHAPYGMPRASETLVEACGDTGRVDTLYLSFMVDRARPGLDSMSAVVYFDPAPGQTLGDFWAFKSGEANGGSLFVEFAPFADVIAEPPWNGIGDATVAYDHQSGRGRLELSFSVPDFAVVGLEEETPYGFARVRIHHRRNTLSGCDQPLCIQWGVGTLFFTTGRQLEIDRGPHRFATRNAGAIDPCATQRAKVAPKAWRPKAPDRTPLKP
jgi:hypothetical protein